MCRVRPGNEKTPGIFPVRTHPCTVFREIANIRAMSFVVNKSWGKGSMVMGWRDFFAIGPSNLFYL
jgi:hypothetical protein